MSDPDIDFFNSKINKFVSYQNSLFIIYAINKNTIRFFNLFNNSISDKKISSIDLDSLSVISFEDLDELRNISKKFIPSFSSFSHNLYALYSKLK